MNFEPELFTLAWSLWKQKGHKPIQKLTVFETHSGNKVFYSIGLLDYQTLENYYFTSQAVFTNYEGALAELGRALDKAEGV